MVICDRPVADVCPVEWARHGGPQRAPVGQGRLRRRRAGEVRPAGPRHARGAAPRVRPRRATSTAASSTLATIPQEDARLRHALPGRLRRGVPGREPRADGDAAPAAPARASTTSSSRSRSSGPGRSRAARCTRSSGAATARSRSPTCTRCCEGRLEKTLGVPLFQEQLMQMAIDVAGFTPPRPTSCARRWARSARRSGWSGCGRGSTRGWPSAGSPARSPTRSSRSCSLRQLRLPREPLGLASPTSSTPRVAQASTTRRRSSPRC